MNSKLIALSILTVGLAGLSVYFDSFWCGLGAALAFVTFLDKV